ncbi:hypothetical protein D7B24_009197 [Verticillium nonalfalfae]|uniref:Uncharacterized protein n=1 Tax=Verticillium nonalfalfae TaxID=1051616 RepID=A0A3M9YK33_9PEZI|nr:uncharacterized protein D7B24_009197 [Verticillium nonalfalfae]RNJ60166.1 hypothetical protein D7B24_009197 [Verticillium nonalfalfae]
MSAHPPNPSSASQQQQKQQKQKQPHQIMRPVVFIPLYIYPFDTAWEPLVRSAATHPSLTFVTVVNPNNGPGPDPRPDASYVAALHQLSALPNVQLLGYVHVSYCTRNQSEVERDMDVYRAWNDDLVRGGAATVNGEEADEEAEEASGSLRVDGIFFDETPWDPSHQDYMARLTRYARNAWERPAPGGAPGGDAVLALNPGVVVEPRWYEDADYVVVFEQSAQHWDDYFVGEGLPQIPDALRPKSVAIVHTVNSSSSSSADGNVDDEADEACALARRICHLGLGGAYLTDEVDGGYTRWPAMWEGELEMLARVNGSSSSSNSTNSSNGTAHEQ